MSYILKMNIFIYLSIFYSLLFVQSKGSVLRVVGGQEAPLGFARFHASLQNLTGHHVCGGAVLSERHLVTAAHCVQGAEPEFIKVVVGTTNLDVGGQQYDVLSIIIYDDFNFSLRTNDIAILKIQGIFDLSYVEIIKPDENELIEGTPLILTGFGAQEPNGASSRLMYVLNLTVFSQDTCNFAMRYTREVCDTMFCTFTQIGQGTCHGDSGGPLTNKDKQLVGLVSWGIPCAVGFPDVHTRITPYIPWIQKEIKN